MVFSACPRTPTIATDDFFSPFLNQKWFRAQGAPNITEIYRIHLVLFGMHNRTMRPYFAAINRILISVMQAPEELGSTLAVYAVAVWANLSMSQKEARKSHNLTRRQERHVHHVRSLYSEQHHVPRKQQEEGYFHASWAKQGFRPLSAGQRLLRRNRGRLECRSLRRSETKILLLVIKRGSECPITHAE
jgi:hypothetical protein